MANAYLDDPVCLLGETSILLSFTELFKSGPGEIYQVIFDISHPVTPQLTPIVTYRWPKITRRYFAGSHLAPGRQSIGDASLRGCETDP